MSKHFLNRIVSGFENLCSFAAETAEAVAEPAGNDTETNGRTAAKPTILVSKRILDSFRRNVGKLTPETGGLLGSSRDECLVDLCHFDRFSKNTPGTFYYDVPSMTAVFQSWQKKGYVTNGIFHSHPKGCVRPSYHDISTSLLHIRFFGIDYFYLPIIQTHRKGLYTMLFYVVKKVEETLTVHLDHVIRATTDGYELLPFRPWEMSYAIEELDRYRDSVDRKPKKQKKPKIEATVAAEPDQKEVPMSNDIICAAPTATPDYFSKVLSLYPDAVLNKVLVCVGTGGARSFLENAARCGFRNYILIDKDIVSPTNVATQAVYISEMGKKKVAVIRDRILDINPAATVLCVDRFLDDDMTDEEFTGFLDRFPGRRPTDYLILGCTDNFEAQKRSAMLALKYGIPYLAAMLYAGGAAAELIFTYPGGVTESCPRCLLRDRFEKYENGFVNDVTSEATPVFATERLNATKGYLALMLLMYHSAPGSPFNDMLDKVADRNFVWVRLDPCLAEGPLHIDMFDRVLPERYTFMDDTLWVPQHPDSPQYGSEPCKMCGGTGDLQTLTVMWADKDTRKIRFTA